MAQKATVSTKMIHAVIALLLGALVFASMLHVVRGVFEQKTYFETKLALLGIRNNIISVSALEAGQVVFETPGTYSYKVTIDGTYISAMPVDSNRDPVTLASIVRPIPHYTPEVVQSGGIIAKKFCIARKQKSAIDCSRVVEVCGADNGVCACAGTICK